MSCFLHLEELYYFLRLDELNFHFYVTAVGIDQIDMQEQSANATAKSSEITKKSEDANSLPSVMMKKERNYQGMFEYRSEDEPLIVKHLIYGQ